MYGQRANMTMQILILRELIKIQKQNMMRGDLTIIKFIIKLTPSMMREDSIMRGKTRIQDVNMIRMVGIFMV